MYARLLSFALSCGLWRCCESNQKISNASTRARESSTWNFSNVNLQSVNFQPITGIYAGVTTAGPFSHFEKAYPTEI